MRETAGVVPEIEDDPLHLLVLERLHFATQGFIGTATELHDLHDADSFLDRNLDFGNGDGVAGDGDRKLVAAAADEELHRRALGAAHPFDGFEKTDPRETEIICLENLIAREKPRFLGGRTLRGVTIVRMPFLSSTCAPMPVTSPLI